MPDVRRRIAMAKSRAGQLRHILSAEELSLDLKLRLYIAGCCSIMTYGAEAWLLDDKACKALNGANAYMLSHITGNNRHYEAAQHSTTFNLLLWIRARRLQWLGHILRLPDERWKRTPEGKKLVKEERLIKKAIRHTHAYRQPGDMLMDIDPSISWDELVKMAQDRDSWKLRVRGLKQAAKARQWAEAAAEKKALRKEIKEAEADTPSQPKSCFSFKAHCVLSATTGAKAGQDKQVQLKFLTGTTADRQSMQAQAKKQNIKNKKMAKAKKRADKKKAKNSTAKYFDFAKKQSDIRQFLTAAPAQQPTATTPAAPTQTAPDSATPRQPPTTTTTPSPHNWPPTPTWGNKWAEPCMPPTPSPTPPTPTTTRWTATTTPLTPPLTAPQTPAPKRAIDVTITTTPTTPITTPPTYTTTTTHQNTPTTPLTTPTTTTTSSNTTTIKTIAKHNKTTNNNNTITPATSANHLIATTPNSNPILPYYPVPISPIHPPSNTKNYLQPLIHSKPFLLQTNLPNPISPYSTSPHIPRPPLVTRKPIWLRYGRGRHRPNPNPNPLIQHNPFLHQHHHNRTLFF